ncbi:MAG: DUF3824 domain-containing protein [Lachnospiraceae bacterium]
MGTVKMDKYQKRRDSKAREKEREKRILRVEKIVAGVIGLAIVAWIGFSIYGKVEQAQLAEVKSIVMDTTAVDEYLQTVSDSVSEESGE